MDNATLIQAFVNQLVTHQPVCLSNSDLNIEATTDALQLIASSGGIVALSQFSRFPVAVRHRSPYWQTIHTVMIAAGLLPTAKSRMSGFYDYQAILVPPGYRVQFSDALDILQAWWLGGRSQSSLSSMLVLDQGHWHPIEGLSCKQGTLMIRTLGDTLKLHPLDHITWLQQESSGSQPVATEESARFVAPPLEAASPAIELQEHRSFSRLKRLGHYLIEADLLSAAQVEVALCDQQATGLRFGEVLVKRGWLKEQTIEFLMSNIILPQRTVAGQKAAFAAQQLRKRLEQKRVSSQQTTVQARVCSPSEHSRELIANQTPAEGRPIPRSEVTAINTRETFITYDRLDIEDLQSWE
ncbi:MAG: hypothetical protein ACFCU8_04455 [Thermosynechococcaceae cyanobacterium]